MDLKQRKMQQYFTYTMLFYVIGFALSFTLTAVQIKDISAYFNLPTKLEGSMNAVTSGASLLALVSILLLQGRIKKSTVLAACGLVMTACMVLKGLVPTFGILLGVFFVYGIALGFGDGNCNAFIVDLNGAESGKYLGALHAFSGMGAMLAPLFITWLRNYMAWQTTYFVMAAIVLVPFGFFTWMCLFMRKRMSGNDAPEIKLTMADVKGYLTDRENLVVMVTNFLYNIFFNGFIVWSTLYMERTLGAPHLRAYPLVAFWVFGASSRFFAPRLNISARKLFLIGTPIGAGALLIGALIGNPVIVLICCAVCGLFAGPGIPVLVDIGCERYQDRSGLPVSILVVVQYTANTVSPMIMAAISAAASLRESMIFATCCGLASTITGLFLIRTGKKG